jgi:hypothetical protein
MSYGGVLGKRCLAARCLAVVYELSWSEHTFVGYTCVEDLYAEKPTGHGCNSRESPTG